MMLRVAAVVLVFACCACSTQSGVQDADLPYSVIFENDPRMRFQGKGAGAGMMLSSSMGPMGIAIGVAIDEGIGKDIQSAVDTYGFNLQLSIQKSLQRARSQYLFLASDSEDAPLKIFIERYGFRTHSGEGDLVTPDIDGAIQYRGKKTVLRYPLDGQEAITLDFDQVKTDGKAASEVFERALYAALDHALAKSLPN